MSKAIGTTRPEAAFEIILKGPGLYPEKIPFHDLRELLASVQQLASGDTTTLDDEEQPESDSFGLLAVKRGSARYVVTNLFPKQAVRHFRDVGSVIKKPQKIGDKEFILSPLRALSAIAKKHGATVLLCRPEHGSTPLAIIEAGTYERIARTALLKGETVLYGKIERIGGASALKCGLRIPGRKRMLICDIASKELAQKLGQNLYENVGVSGNATWMRATWSVLEFQISSFTKPMRKPMIDFFIDLRKAGGDAWDAIEDPECYLNPTG